MPAALEGRLQADAQHVLDELLVGGDAHADAADPGAAAPKEPKP